MKNMWWTYGEVAGDGNERSSATESQMKKTRKLKLITLEEDIQAHDELYWNQETSGIYVLCDISLPCY